MEGKYLFVKIFVIMIFISCVSGQEQVDSKIISGKPVNICQYPFIVGIRLRDLDAVSFGAGQICAGSLISSAKVVTAGHCLRHQNPPARYLITLGIDKKNDKRNVFLSGVKKYKIHEKFKSLRFKNDIAVVILENAVPANHPVIKPIMLPKAKPVIGWTCDIAGWGSHDFGGQHSNQLLATTVPIVAKLNCQKNYIEPLPFGMLCAGGGRKEDSCHGDSGGPLTHRNELVGIISIKLVCGLERFSTIYTDVHAYKGWINAVSERSKGVSSFGSNDITVFYTLLTSLSWCFIKK